MSLKDLLVHVDATPQGMARLSVAADVAQAHQAYVTGLFLKEPRREPSALAVAAGAYVGSPDPDQSSGQQLADAAGRAAASCEAEFRKGLERAGVKGARTVAESASPRAIVRYAGNADLVIIGKVIPSPDGESTDLPAEIALACGRPVLVVPDGPFKSVGDRVMIAWNARRELIRAVNDALPLLKRATFVALFEIGEKDTGPEALEGISQHLARHGVKAERYVIAASDQDVGRGILSRAEDFDCDLIVMGAYGHTRLREIVFGGATHTVMSAMKLPVLLSH